MSRGPIRQVTNAFGVGSPSWNTPFPNGNLTAAEILTYLPHWLKSIDVIDRFITNGGKSHVIAYMINEFRYQPRGGTVFVPNSVCRMMQYAMRRAGFDNWTVGNHKNWSREGAWDESDLNVDGFRTPRITHPKALALSNEAAPIQFRSLSLHVKKHPIGPDALDLTRCVLYTLEHPYENWLFPNDFEKLVKKLGGEAEVSHSHCDRQVFARRHPNSTLHKLPAQVTPLTRVPARNNTLMARTRSAAIINDKATPASLQKRTRTIDNGGSIRVGNKRRSGRLIEKPNINLNEDTDSEATDVDVEDPNPRKKRKVDSSISDGDFVQRTESSSSEAEDTNNLTDDSLYNTTPVRKGRVAAQKARKAIQKESKKRFLASPVAPPKPKRIEIPIDPELMKLARNHDKQIATLLKPPVLSHDRLVVDQRSIYLYAEEGATDLWASALSSTRFGGPRRHPPFRELHRLTDPDPRDESDWAENIRWAKEQHMMYGSKTWTEYDYHLEQITEHRRETLWVSEEIISRGL